MPSTVCRLTSDLHAITETLADLIRELPIKHPANTDTVVFIAPKYYWSEVSAEQLNAQLTIKREYDEWFEVFRSVFRKAAKSVNRRIERAAKSFRQWIELSSNWSISHNRTANEKRLRHDAERFIKLLAILGESRALGTILITDTNAIVNEPDPIRYRAIAQCKSFVFLLLPTVLAELDDLKNLHRNPDFREKVKNVVTKIKGWRNQGPLLNGVTVGKTITVKAFAREPDMKHALTWLDEHNHDDRLIAAVLEVQSVHPAARVVLITGDINLMNKADLARIETAELRPS